MYLASGPSEARGVWESLVQFTPGYFRFHASRGGFEPRWYLVLLFAQVALLLVAFAVIFTYPLFEFAFG